MEEDLKDLKDFRKALRSFHISFNKKFTNVYQEFLEGYVRDAMDEVDVQIEEMMGDIKESYRLFSDNNS